MLNAFCVSAVPSISVVHVQLFVKAPQPLGQSEIMEEFTIISPLELTMRLTRTVQAFFNFSLSYSIICIVARVKVKMNIFLSDEELELCTVVHSDNKQHNDGQTYCDALFILSDYQLPFDNDQTQMRLDCK